MKNLLLVLLFFLPDSVQCQDKLLKEEDTNSITQKTLHNADTIAISEKCFFIKHYDIVHNDTILTDAYYLLDTNSVRVIHGSVITYSKGCVAKISNFHLGKKEGIEIWLSNDSKSIELQLEYKNDTINGLLVEYYPSGSIKKIGNCFGHFTLRYGKWVWYYENGNKKAEGMYGIIKMSDSFEIKNVRMDHISISNIYEFVSVKIGEWIYYNPDGTIQKKETHTKPQLAIEMD